jgi:hypothetical protein
MGMSDYDLEIGLLKFHILELSNEIEKLCAEIQTLETTLAAMSGELHALRMDTQ